MIIERFFVGKNEYCLHFQNDEFILELLPNEKEFDKDFWIKFKDEGTFDDVNENINVFEVIIKAVDVIVKYVKIHKLKYFRFMASTDRKAKIYGRVAKRIQRNLKDFVCIDENYLYTFIKIEYN